MAKKKKVDQISLIKPNYDHNRSFNLLLKRCIFHGPRFTVFPEYDNANRDLAIYCLESFIELINDNSNIIYFVEENSEPLINSIPAIKTTSLVHKLVNEHIGSEEYIFIQDVAYMYEIINIIRERDLKVIYFSKNTDDSSEVFDNHVDNMFFLDSDGIAYRSNIYNERFDYPVDFLKRLIKLENLCKVSKQLKLF